MNASKYVLRMAFKYSQDKELWKEHFDDMTFNEIIDMCMVDFKREAEVKASAEMKEKVKSILFRLDILED